MASEQQLQVDWRIGSVRSAPCLLSNTGHKTQRPGTDGCVKRYRNMARSKVRQGAWTSKQVAFLCQQWCVTQQQTVMETLAAPTNPGSIKHPLLLNEFLISNKGHCCYSNLACVMWCVIKKGDLQAVMKLCLWNINQHNHIKQRSLQTVIVFAIRNKVRLSHQLSVIK